MVLEACALFGVNQVSTAVSPANYALRTFALEPFRFVGVLHIVLMNEAKARKDEAWWHAVHASASFSIDMAPPMWAISKMKKLTWVH